MINNASFKLLSKTLNHMVHISSGARRGSILLTGDPGIGKTTFIKLLSKMTGLPAVIIEVPHITEEHIINIPFVVITDKDTENKAVKVENDDKYKLVLANSNLYTHLIHSIPLTDQEYIESIKHSPSLLQQFYKELGGTDTSLPPLIKQIRNQHSVILFLDEFLRETSPRIQNILRDILDGKIGLHDIPKSTYVMYATNKSDTGISSDIPINRQFKEVEYPVPSKEDWFQWFESKYADAHHLDINKKVIEKFKTILTDEHISFHDVDTDIRTSPRRWEQLMLYIGTSLPAKNEKDAQSLLSNVKHNFVDYETGHHSSLTDKVLQAVVELIKETSNLSMTINHINQHSDWRNTLDHQIQTAMKLGEHRTYVPVISGPPGIGKTTHIAVIARDNNMLPIVVRCGNLNADDIVGIPLPGGRDTDTMSVKFSVPKLHEIITREVKKTEAAFHDMLKKQDPKTAEDKFKQFKNQKWKYLIFFDEINNVSEQTFNALRRVLLERNFGPKDDGSGKTLDLPKGSVVVAAMNPTGSHTTKLTKHFKDVIDPIQAAPNWEHTKEYLKTKNIPNIPEETKNTLISLIERFVDRFKSPSKSTTSKEHAFTLHFGTDIYISPREYEDMLSDLALETISIIQKLKAKNAEDNKSDLLQELKDNLSQGFIEALNFIFTKHGIHDATEPKGIIRSWVDSLSTDAFSGIISRKISTESAPKISNNLDKYIDGTKLTELPEDIHFININNAADDMEFVDLAKNTIVDKLKTNDDIKKYVLDEDHPVITINDNKDGLEYSDKEKVSLLHNFILACLYTLHLHEFSFERLQHISKIVTRSMTDIIRENKNLDDEIKTQAVTAAIQSILKVTKSLKDLK